MHIYRGSKSAERTYLRQLERRHEQTPISQKREIFLVVAVVAFILLVVKVLHLDWLA